MSAEHGARFVDANEMVVGEAQDGSPFPVSVGDIGSLLASLGADGGGATSWLIDRVKFCPRCGSRASGFKIRGVVGCETKSHGIQVDCPRCGSF